MRLSLSRLLKINWKSREKRALAKASREIDRALAARRKGDTETTSAPAALDYLR